MQKEKILILGATGNLGQSVAVALTKHHPDISLRLTSSRATGVVSLQDQFPESEVLQANWYDVDSLTTATSGVDHIFVVTPDFVTDETLATPNVISAARSSGTVKQLVRLIAIPPGLTMDDLSPEEHATRCGAALHMVAKPLLDASGLPITYINIPCWIMFNLPWFLAQEVKENQRIAMPAQSDAPRLWVSETDIAEVAAKLLTNPVQDHIGKEYVLTGAERYGFAELALMLGEVLGKSIAYVDDAASLKNIMGDTFDTLMTYFEHETRDYGDVVPTDTVSQLLGRPQITLRDYLIANRDLFI